MSSRGVATNITPVPLGKVALLGAILLANNASIWMIFSFLPFMVQFYYPTLPTTELGFEAGILGSAFSAGGLIGNLVSGIISDKVGRRPALLWGLAGTAISSLCFGFSPNFWFAVGSRFMWGALNGNIGVAKTYLAEISDDTNMTRSMAYFGVIGSTGRVIGPIIGGLLSYPADNFSIFRHTMFDSHPFALPALMISINCMIIFTIAYFFLPETLNVKKLDDYRGHIDSGRRGNRSRDGLQYSALQTSDADTLDSPSEHGTNGASQVGSVGVSTAVDDSASERTIEMSVVPRGDGNSCSGRNGAAAVSNPMLTAENLSSKGFTMLGAGQNRLSGETDEESEAGLRGVEGGLEMTSMANPGDRDLESGCASPLRSYTPPPRGGRQGQRKAISFSSHVRVKVIDRPGVYIQSLKQVGPDEAPLSSPEGGRVGANSSALAGEEDDVVDSVDEDDMQEELLPPAVRYSNGAEFFESVDSSQSSMLSNFAYLMRQRHVVITTTLYGFSSFITIIGNEVFTLWVVNSPEDGGLSYTTQQIGLATMICGVIGTVLQLNVYPLATDALGVLWVHRCGGLALALSCVLIPMLAWGVTSRPAAVTMVLVVLTLTLQAVAANWYLVSTFVLISNSCYRHQLATVNGIGQTCASIGRLCGPYIGSVTFAWSATNGLSWPFNQYFVFYVLALLAVLNYQYSLLLPRSIQRRKREPRFRTWEEAEEFLRQQEVLSQRAADEQDRQRSEGEERSHSELPEAGRSSANGESRHAVAV